MTFLFLLLFLQASTTEELNLAKAYAAQLIPDVPSERNREFAKRAIESFESVLRREPGNRAAVKGLAEVYRDTSEFRKARGYYLRNAELDPLNPTAFYAVGAVDWSIVLNRTTAVAPEEQADLVGEGLRYLDIALAINPDYDEAMMYKNLLLRERARLAVSTVEKKRLIAEADEWFDKALATRKKNQKAGVPSPERFRPPIPPPLPPSPPPPPRPPLQTTGVRVSSDAAEANLLFRPALAYPPLAEAARLQGKVVIEVIISRDGTIRDQRVVSGHPLLSGAALENAKQSRYEPFVLNGEATEVITTISLTYRLP